MEYYPTFKHWFGHSGFVAAGHLEGSGIVLGQVIADKRHKRHKEERCVIVDWGAKFPLICKLEMRQGGKDEHIRKPNLREDKMADPEVPIDYKIKMLMADNQRKFEVGDFVVCLIHEMEATDHFLTHEFGITYRMSKGEILRKPFAEEFHPEWLKAYNEKRDAPKDEDSIGDRDPTKWNK